MDKRMRDMRYYVSNGEGVHVLIKLTAAFTAAAVVATACLVIWEVPLALTLLLAGWLWCYALWVMTNTIVEIVRSARLAGTVGKGAEAAVQLIDFEAAASLCGDRLRVGRRFVFARKGGVIPCAEIRRACLARERSKDSAFVIYLAEDAGGAQRILARWREKQFAQEDAERISVALAARCDQITFGSYASDETF